MDFYSFSAISFSTLQTSDSLAVRRQTLSPLRNRTIIVRVKSDQSEINPRRQRPAHESRARHNLFTDEVAVPHGSECVIRRHSTTDVTRRHWNPIPALDDSLTKTHLHSTIDMCKSVFRAAKRFRVT